MHLIDGGSLALYWQGEWGVALYWLEGGCGGGALHFIGFTVGKVRGVGGCSALSWLSGMCGGGWGRDAVHCAGWCTPSRKQPFSFLGRLAINSYLALCQQESDSVACGSAWLTVHSGGWGYRVICVFPSSLQLKK